MLDLVLEGAGIGSRALGLESLWGVFGEENGL